MMNKKLIKIVTVSTILVFGAAALINVNQRKTVKLEAAQHVGNFAEYSYEGNYYNNLNTSGENGLNGSFRKALSSLIFPKAWYTYGSSGENHLSTQLQYCDEDPTNSSNMIYFYTRDSVKKNAASTWNREHVWPQSLSCNKWGTGQAGTDLLHLRPTYNNTNSARGNLVYGDINKQGQVTYNDMVYGYIGSDRFEPLDEVKGDVARIIMYVWTAYYDHYNASDLLVTKTIESYDTLLKWHTLDKPDALEGNRNNYCETSNQKNRNPFVDHPEYAWRIFGNCVTDQNILNSCKATYPETGNTSRVFTSISITGEANKKTYYVGESFDPTGLTVKANYSNGDSETINLADCSWSPNPLTEGTTAVTCTYENKTATYSGITVSRRPVTTNGQFNAIFRKAASDGSGELTTANILNECESNTLFASVKEATKVYAGTQGLKLGSSKANGIVTFNLNSEARSNISRIAMETAQYGTDDGLIAVTLGNTVVAENIVPGRSFSIEVNNINGSTLTISTTTKRAYISSVSIDVSSGSMPDNSSSSSSSTSNSSSSSESQVSSQNSSSSIEETSSSNNNGRQNKGCGGSIFVTSTLLTFASIISLTVVFSKKKK